MNLLTDYFSVDAIKVISESTSKGTMRVKGIFGRADEFNNNNRRYKKSILEREMGKLQPLIQERRLLGELDHPEYTSVKLTNVSHLITNLSWDGNKLIGEAEILNTPSGKVAQQLIKDGVKIGISSRGLGTLQECKDVPGKMEVCEDYRMVTFDLVADPSTRGAYPTLTESKKIELAKRTQLQALQENALINLLKNKLKKKEVISVEESKEEFDTLYKSNDLYNKLKNVLSEGSMSHKKVQRMRQELNKSDTDWDKVNSANQKLANRKVKDKKTRKLNPDRLSSNSPNYFKKKDKVEEGSMSLMRAKRKLKNHPEKAWDKKDKIGKKDSFREVEGYPPLRHKLTKRQSIERSKDKK